MTVSDSDLESLVERCKSGNNQAQHALYERYADAMYNVSLRIVHNTGEAEDILQLAFIEAFRNLENLNSNNLFSAWLKRIVINRSIDCLRKKDRIDIISLDDDQNNIQIPQESFSTNHDSSVEVLIGKVRDGIDRLADGYRTVLSLYLLEGYDHQEIANFLGISETTSRTQYMRAKNKLRELVNENINNEL